MNLLKILKRDYIGKKLSKEDIKIFFNHGIITKEQYYEIINSEQKDTY